ncbi:MAG: HyaD/HybD family hydrogenase maturation endopeptidase [Actinomycetota bacterium]|nr:HyaD/HybD family hydrogenase maturation endopeptidase [Actinomycetota bacterium]
MAGKGEARGWYGHDSKEIAEQLEWVMLQLARLLRGKRKLVKSDIQRPDPHRRIVIGIGNILNSDDGVGVYALRTLQEMLPPDVETLEGSVYCADLLPYIENKSKVIFLDGVDAGDEPGAIYRFDGKEVEKAYSIPVSLHEFGVSELIAVAELLGQCPEEIVLFCVQVRKIETGMELSKEVKEAIPKLCELVLSELGIEKL